MALIYITGLAGTGKSTLCQQLRGRGYIAFDADIDGINGWRHIATGSPVYDVNIPGYLTEQWYQDYEWSIGRKRVEELAKLAEDQPVFLCGASANDEEVHDLLKTVVFLTIDEQTLLDRLANRDTNDWGKKPEDVAHALRWLKPAEEYYRNFGAVMLDSTQPLEDLVSQVLQYAEVSPQLA